MNSKFDLAAHNLAMLRVWHLAEIGSINFEDKDELYTKYKAESDDFVELQSESSA